MTQVKSQIKLIEFQGAFKEGDKDNLTNMFQDMMTATGGRFFRKDRNDQDFQGFLELMEAVRKAAKSAGDVTDPIVKAAKESQRKIYKNQIWYY